jgi:succinate dehydrogenase / fumarate reductase cytochrome b subunit
MSDRAAKPRPQFKNINVWQLINYRLPLAGQLSILHRVSGAMLFLMLPTVILPLFAMSFTSPQGFAKLAVVTDMWFVKLVLLALLWGFLHHFCAGIRYLALDLHHGLDKHAAKRSAGVVFGVSLGLTVVFGLKLFGAW